ncbi:hypothetical protein V5O48_004641 [Marasmius crinis-equi]|uniref:Protein kinase domain-containing protein n=1 Tax=Marasmius crinis-equi TaxID=585013 RepID=A0ABR3FPG2_9AGAR
MDSCEVLSTESQATESRPTQKTIRNSKELRALVSSGTIQPWEPAPTFEFSETWSPSVVADWLDQELQLSEDKDVHVRCTRLIDRIAKKHHHFPSSLFIDNIEVVGKLPVKHGGFAHIFKGKHTNETPASVPTDPPILCLKVVQMYEHDEPAEKEKKISDFCREAIIWKRLYHTNIHPFLGVNKILFDNALCLVSPWMENGDLMGFLKLNPTHDKLRAIMEIARGLAYLHSLSPMIVHGDIKGVNVLVSPDLTCRLADFGLSRIAYENNPYGETMSRELPAGTTRWKAPEMFTDSNVTESRKEHAPRDIYAFACTILEIITQKVPFSELNDGQFMLKIFTNELQPRRPTSPFWCPDEMWNLMVQCWNVAPSKRPTADTALDFLERYEAYIIARSLPPSQENLMPLPKYPELPSLDPQGPPKVVEERPGLSGTRSEVAIDAQTTEAGDEGSTLLVPVGEVLPHTTEVVIRRPGKSSLGMTELPAFNDQTTHIVGNFEDLQGVLSSDQTLDSDSWSLKLAFSETWSALMVADWLDEQETRSPDKHFQAHCRWLLDAIADECHEIPSRLWFLDEIEPIGKHPVHTGVDTDVWKVRGPNQNLGFKAVRVDHFWRNSELSERRSLVSEFCRTALIWSRLSHRHVHRFIGVDMKLALYVVSPWEERGNIITFLQENPNHNKLRSIREIASGLAYLHSQQTVHGNLQGSNILVDHNNTCQLAGFYFCPRNAPHNVEESRFNENLRWMAPEQISTASSFHVRGPSQPADVYAYACTVLEIITGKPPFSDHDNSVAAVRITLGQRPPRPSPTTVSWCPDEVWSLVEQCWAKNPSHRPTARSIDRYLAHYQASRQLTASWSQSQTSRDDGSSEYESSYEVDIESLVEAPRLVELGSTEEFLGLAELFENPEWSPQEKEEAERAQTRDRGRARGLSMKLPVALKGPLALFKSGISSPFRRRNRRAKEASSPSYPSEQQRERTTIIPHSAPASFSERSQNSGPMRQWRVWREAMVRSGTSLRSTASGGRGLAYTG